ncbi:uncharacterized protein LOC125479610, partial [Pyrus x bretschneideri]|uniref:uncharacterized protein LOC125479610 n=1 Tax=Pyrus x bretschneideri TaxID=225117 RepID=UPI00202F2650
MNNGVYELIMLLKTTVIAKPKLLTTSLLFWNLETNTFDLRMGLMSLTILNMAQVFKLRPLGRVVDVTHDWSHFSYSIVESSSSSAPFLQIESNSSTFKSYGTSFTGFSPFANKSFGPTSFTANRDQEHMYFLLYWLNKHVFPNKSKEMKVEWIPLVEALHNFDDMATGPFILFHLYHLLFEMTRGKPLKLTSIGQPGWSNYSCNEIDIGQDEDAADAFVLQEAAAKAEGQGARQAKVGTAASLVGQSSTSIPSTSSPLVVAPTSQFDLSNGEMLHFVEDDSNPPSPGQKLHQPAATAFWEPIVLVIPVVSKVPSPRASWPASTDAAVASEMSISQPRAFGEGSGNISPSPASNDDSLYQPREPTPPHSKDLSSTQGLGEGSGQSPPPLKSSLLHHIPKFHGLSMEDPNKHLKEFEVVCSSMTPVTVDGSILKMKAFPFSLMDKAKDWLYELAPETVTSWESMKRAFLEKFFPTSRVILLRKKISGIQQNHGETFPAYHERFKGLVASCPQHQMKEELLLQYFYEGLLPIERQMLDASAGGALVDKTPRDAKINMPNVPFPRRFMQEKKEESEKDIFETFRKVQVNIPLLDAIKQVPKYAKFLKDLCNTKRRRANKEVVKVSENVSAVLQHKLPTKCKDPGSFTIPCVIGHNRFEHAMLDLGASINVMPYSIYASMNLGELKQDGVIIQLADRSNAYPKGVLEDVLVQVNHLIFPADFYVLDMEDSSHAPSLPILLGRPFMKTARTKIDVYTGTLTMEFDGDIIHFNLSETIKHPIEDHSCFAIDIVDY